MGREREVLCYLEQAAKAGALETVDGPLLWFALVLLKSLYCVFMPFLVLSSVIDALKKQAIGHVKTTALVNVVAVSFIARPPVCIQRYRAED